MKKNFLIALVAMLVPFVVLAQFSISGTVTDQSTRQALAGASIQIGNKLAQTDATGSFRISELASGNYALKISYLGYRTYSKTIYLARNENLNITLSPISIISEEAIVKATRAQAKTPATYRNVSREELEKNNLGQDLPYLLNQTPSVVVSSDAGTGIGYTGIRIRGSDPTRVNVTINGIPYNDPESQGTFFVDIPDIASSVDNIQIQRGVGTSTNGAGAFGASLNVQTATRRDSAYLELNNSAGSYETMKNTLSLGTGLINDRFTFDGRLSRIKSEGYIQPGFSNLKSYFLSGAYYGNKDILRANVFSGTERTYQAWNGISEAQLLINRRANPFRYDDQTDNYTQDHYQLLHTHNFSSVLSSNVGLHYTWGRGYYEEYKEDDDLENYGIPAVQVNNTTMETSNIIRRRWLDNDFYGITYSLNYNPVTDLALTLGGAYNEYDGAHFGEVLWSQFNATSNFRDRYYDGKGFKTDFNIYGRADYSIDKVTLYGDLQYRKVSHSINGTDKNRRQLNQSHDNSFFNPKVGISFQPLENLSFYSSFAVANKEPNRDDYINSTQGNVPQSENLKNLEIGSTFKRKNFQASLNGYGMFYKDQLVLTGEVNDVGESIRKNVPDSYRIGLEFDGRISFTKKLSMSSTASLSKNRIKEFKETIYIYNEDFDVSGSEENIYKDSKIAYSPSFIWSNEFTAKPVANFEFSLISKYVGRQFLDNTSDQNRVINSYFTNDVRFRYNTKLKRVKNVRVTLLVNNLFSTLYESNGYTYSYYYLNDLVTENFYFPQAERNFLLGVNLSF